MTTCEKCGGKLYAPGELVRVGVDEMPPVPGHKPGCPDGLVCRHESLRRACPTCEAEAALAEAREEQLRLAGLVVVCDGEHQELVRVKELFRLEAAARDLAEARADSLRDTLALQVKGYEAEGVHAATRNICRRCLKSAALAAQKAAGEKKP